MKLVPGYAQRAKLEAEGQMPLPLKIAMPWTLEEIREAAKAGDWGKFWGHVKEKK